MVGGFYVLGLEGRIWFLFIFFWLAFVYLVIVSCKGRWGACFSSGFRKKRIGKLGLVNS